MAGYSVMLQTDVSLFMREKGNNPITDQDLFYNKILKLESLRSPGLVIINPAQCASNDVVEDSKKLKSP